MNNVSKTLLAAALVSMAGCSTSSYTDSNSTYEDHSTPNKRDIKATGRAAEEAARSNRSTHAIINAGGNSVEYSIPVSGPSHFDAIPHGHRSDGSCIYPSSWRSDADIYQWAGQQQMDQQQREYNARRARANELFNGAMDDVGTEIRREVQIRLRELFGR